MRIYVEERDKKRTIRFPTRLAVNRLTAAIAGAAVRKRTDTELSTAALVRFAREINRAKASLRRMRLPLVEVESSGGECVRISL